jgi:hypothetical protein
VYDLLRATGPAGFGSPFCVESDGADAAAQDGELPGAARLFFYLVRAENGCGGNLGTDSAGTPRTGGPCP